MKKIVPCAVGLSMDLWFVVSPDLELKCERSHHKQFPKPSVPHTITWHDLFLCGETKDSSLTSLLFMRPDIDEIMNLFWNWLYSDSRCSISFFKRMSSYVLCAHIIFNLTDGSECRMLRAIWKHGATPVPQQISPTWSPVHAEPKVSWFNNINLLSRWHITEEGT